MNIEDKVCKDIDKLVNKIDILKKKKRLWGLSVAEDNDMVKMILQYFQNFYKLIDIVFCNYIEPLMYTDEIIQLKAELFDKYKWEGNILIFEEDMKIYDNIKEVYEFMVLIEKLRECEKKEARKFANTEYGKEACEMFCALQNIDDCQCIEKYIDIRYDLILSIIDMESETWED